MEEHISIRKHYEKSIQMEINQFERFRDQAMKRSSVDNIRRFEDKIQQLRSELEEEDTPRFQAFLEEQMALIKLQKKNQTMIKTDETQREKLDAFYKIENKARRDDRYLQHQARREWDWLCNQDDRLPDYIRENLARMAGNKGYIWKGIWYFGKQIVPPRDADMLVMFERPRGSSDTLIHEIKQGVYHRVYRKNKHPPHTLLSETFPKMK